MNQTVNLDQCNFEVMKSNCLVNLCLLTLLLALVVCHRLWIHLNSFTRFIFFFEMVHRANN